MIIQAEAKNPSYAIKKSSLERRFMVGDVIESEKGKELVSSIATDRIGTIRIVYIKKLKDRKYSEFLEQNDYHVKYLGDTLVLDAFSTRCEEVPIREIESFKEIISRASPRAKLSEAVL